MSVDYEMNEESARNAEKDRGIASVPRNRPPISRPPSRPVGPPPEEYHPELPWHTYSINECIKITLSSDPEGVKENGLGQNDVIFHREEFGDNAIPVKGGPNILKMLFSHFCNSITVILGIVALVSGYFQDWGEFGVVIFVILFNGCLGFYQEYGAEKSLQGLKEMTAGSAKVLRDGKVMVIPIDDVVVGDIVILEQGASVPADVRLIEVSNLEIDEALLTGEALPVLKQVDSIEDPDLRCALGDQKNLAFRTTMVSQGRGKGVVIASGVYTQMGRLAAKLSDNSKSNKTALQRKLEILMYCLFGVCLLLAVVVFGANKFIFTETTIIYACAVAIAILPESLVAVMTVAMTISVRRIAKQKCIVRKLGALEVLGNVTDICSDKTGTLTENKMVVKCLLVGVEEHFNVTGRPTGQFGVFVHAEHGPDHVGNSVTPPPQTPQLASPTSHQHGRAVQMEDQSAMYRNFFRCAALCSATTLTVDPDNEEDLTGSGNPTEIAIQVMTWKANLNRTLFEEEGWELYGEFAFDSSSKRASMVFRKKHNPRELYSCTKGASERILTLCIRYFDQDGVKRDLDDISRKRITECIDQFAHQGLRTICFAERDLEEAPLPIPDDPQVRFDREHTREAVEGDLIFLGIVGIYDPPRPESLPSVRTCQQAGIKVRMLTGDHVATATSIAQSLNIVPKAVTDAMVMAGPDLDRLTEEEEDAHEDLPFVVGRCSPESKVKMIEALHRRAGVVAMTGDGFNDSPSIKIADIGCAMGSGTDVTKGVADIVITDDNFATIVKAVAEGRRISECIKKFVIHLLSGNVAEVIVLILGLPIQIDGLSVFVLSPIQILYLNMFTGSPPATGLSLDEADESILHVPPNRKGFFSRELIADTFIYGTFLGTVSLMSFVFVVYGVHGGFDPKSKNCNTTRGENCTIVWTARSTAFVVLYLGLLLHAYNVRCSRKSVFKIKWFDNRWLWGSIVFGVVTLMLFLYIKWIALNIFVHEGLSWEWGVVIFALTVFMALSEVYKILKNRFFPLEVVHLPPVMTTTQPAGSPTVTTSAGRFHHEGGEVTDGVPPSLDVTVSHSHENILDIARENLAHSYTISAAHTDR